VFLEALEVPGGLVSDCSKLCGEHPRPAGARVSRKLSTPLRVSCAVDHEVSFVTCSTADQGGAVLEDMWLLLTSGTLRALVCSRCVLLARRLGNHASRHCSLNIDTTSTMLPSLKSDMAYDDCALTAIELLSRSRYSQELLALFA
jgi:hypothetical protein